MTSVWKRLQRVGKKAAKFQFAASFQELMLECTNKWQPDKLRVVWVRRNRRHSTKLHSWQPGIQNPYRGLVIWQVPETLDITVTLFKEPNTEEFEDKDWTFVIENETKGSRKVLASADLNMKKFASHMPAQFDVTLKFKPLSVKVVEATLKLNLSSIFLKAGKATDEDMQSMASLMSMNQSDIGNLEDFNDSDDEAGEERWASFGIGQATHVSEFKRHLGTLNEEDNQCTTPTSHDPRGSARWRLESSKSTGKKRDAHGVKATGGHENMALPQPSCPNVAGAADPPSQTQIHTVEQQLEKRPTNRTIPWEELPKATPVKYPTSKTIQWEELPKVTAEVTRSKLEEKMKTTEDIISLVPSLPDTAMITRLSSIMLDSDDVLTTKTEAGRTDLLPVCSTVRDIFEFTEQANECLRSRDSAAQSIHIQDFAKPETEDKQTNPAVINITGIPFEGTGKEAPCLPEQKLGENSKTMEELQPFASKDVKKNNKEVVLPITACARVSRIQDSPSVLHCSSFCYVLNLVDICPSCPSVSNITRSPSISEDNNRSWTSERDQLFERKMKSKLSIAASPLEKDEIKLMVALLPLCPNHSCIRGIASIMQPAIATCVSDLIISGSKMSNIQSIPSFIDLFNGSTDRYCNPLAFACPQEACITGLSSTMEPTTSFAGFNRLNLLPSFPATTHMTGFPSIQKLDTKDWSTIWEPFWEKQIKKEYVLLIDNCKNGNNMKGVHSLATSCPRKTLIYGFPSIPKPRMMNDFDMVSLSGLCSKMSQVPGFQSSHYSADWITCREPIFEARKKETMKEKLVSMTDANERVKRAMKTMVSLLPSCPKEARLPGFPSLTNPLNVCCSQSTVSLLAMSPQVSKIAGFPSVEGYTSLGWLPEMGVLLKKLPKKGVISDPLNHSKNMRNMVSCVPSCPKKSCITGFPSIPNPQKVYYGQNIVGLLPMCPIVSTKPGFSSVEGHKEKWVAEQGTFMPRPIKNTKCKINSSLINMDKQKNMFALAPSCSRGSKISGFSSIPRCNMQNIVPACPKFSSLPEFATFENASKFQGLCKPHILLDKPSNEIVFVTPRPIPNEETVKAILSLAPSFPEASRIPGLPCAPQTTSKTNPNMLSFIHCCSSASTIDGFASTSTTLNTEWLNETKPILGEPQMTRAEMVMLLTIRDQPYCDYMKSMVTFVTSCPKEARVCGFPSAQVTNRQPYMAILCTSAPCVSSIPGFPSARMLNAECMNIQARAIHSKFLFEKLQNVANFQGKHNYSQEDMNYMAAMAPSCPHSTQMSGIPSISQLKPAEKEMMIIPFPCSTKDQTSLDHHTQSSQSYHKDVGIPAAPPISFIRPGTAIVYGNNLKGDETRNIALSVDEGISEEFCIVLLYELCGSLLTILYMWAFSKSPLDRLAELETQTSQLDTAEPAGVLGWELLEAEGTTTENQTESSLFTEEDTSGLFKTIAGVFYKGYETVTFILGSSNPTFAEVDHQPKDVPSVDMKDKPVILTDVSDPHFLGDTHPIQKPVDRFEAFVTKHDVEYSSSVEPFMWDLVGRSSASLSSSTDSEDEFLKKWPPLTVVDITKISNEDSEPVEAQEPLQDQWNAKEGSLTGPDSIQALVYVERLVAGHQTEAVKDEFRTVSTSLQLDKGLPKTNMDISATSLQPATNELLTDANANNKTLVDKPSDFQQISVEEPQADIAAPQQGRKPKKKASEHQQESTVPLRPLRRKDGIMPNHKEKSNSLSVKILPEVIPVNSVRKDSTGEVLSTQNAIASYCNIKEGDISLGVQENSGAKVTQCDDDGQKGKSESVQMSMDLVPPPRVTRGDCIFPLETQRETCKLFERKDDVARETQSFKN